MDIDGLELRDALGRFATGVCVITTNQEQKPIGMTVNSFASVSLDPPLVLWSLQNNSDVYRAFSAPAHFAINILSKDQQDLSNLYARKGDHLLQEDHYRIGKYGSPIIRNALTTLECELEITHEGGDHLIIVGRVRDMHTRPTGNPLLFFSGSYRELH
jgi:flavin reductase (DIM6/NTAB) family NADH-FMN oxidoreductase RutF